MKKEARCKCKYCGAKHRDSFMLIFPDKTVCNDCAFEYRKIFFNFQNRQSRKSGKNPLFEAFERGWVIEEMQQGLDHKEIPQFMKESYDRLWEIEKAKWNELRKDPTVYKFNRIKRMDDGISENQ